MMMLEHYMSREYSYTTYIITRLNKIRQSHHEQTKIVITTQCKRRTIIR